MGTEREFDAISSEAVASSEKEFFADAMGEAESVLDESGDQSLEEMGKGLEGQHDSDDEDTGNEVVAKEPEAETPKGKSDDNRDDDGRFKRNETPAERGLRNELVAERTRARAAEEAQKALAAKIEALEARFATVAVQPQQPIPPVPQAQQPQPQNEPPDRWTDPDGYDKWNREQIVREIEGKRVAWSFEEAATRHGDAFKQAYAAADALTGPAGQQLLDAVRSSANPGERLVTWHKQQLAMREIGNDPVAFAARKEAELREKLLNDPEFQKQIREKLTDAPGAHDAAPLKNITRLPPSLNSARGGSATRQASGGTSDAELFSEVMG